MLPIFFNMKITLKIIILFVFVNVSFSQNVNIGLDFEIKKGSKFTNIVKFGIHEDATDNYDGELGEDDLPGHPPSNLHAFMRFYDENQQSVLNSYTDYRAIRNQDTFHIRYTVSVRFESNDTLIIKWKNLDYISKAIFIDKFNGLQYEIDMLEESFVEIGNSAFDEFYIDIYYDKNFTDVQEINQIDEFIPYPNPTSGNFSFQNESMIKSIEIYDMFGNHIDGIDYKTNMMNLKQGIYYLKICDIKNKYYMRRLVKVN